MASSCLFPVSSLNTLEARSARLRLEECQQRLADALTPTARAHVHAFELTVLFAEYHRAATNGLTVRRPHDREDDVGLAQGGDGNAVMALQRIERLLIRIQFFDEAHHIRLIRVLDGDGHGCKNS